MYGDRRQFLNILSNAGKLVVPNTTGIVTSAINNPSAEGWIDVRNQSFIRVIHEGKAAHVRFDGGCVKTRQRDLTSG